MTNSERKHSTEIPVQPQTWEHDYDAINSAIKTLSIQYPVSVEPVPIRHRGQYCGTVEDAEHGLIHVIYVRQDLTPHEASRVIWHELGHAAQCERAGGAHAYVAAYRGQIEEAGLDYDRFDDNDYTIEHERTIMSIPFEREADAVLHEHGLNRLTRSVST